MNFLSKSAVAALVITLSFTATPSYAAKIYLWYTIENGEKVPNYGENPPMGTNATLVSDEPSPPKQQAPSQQTNASDSKLNEQQKALKAQREEDCRLETGRLATLKSSGSRIRMEQDDGTSRYLSPDEIAAEIKQSEDFIKQACSS